MGCSIAERHLVTLRLRREARDRGRDAHSPVP